MAGDPDLAAEHLAGHHDSAAALFFAALAPEHDLARLRTATSTVAPGATAALPGDWRRELLRRFRLDQG